MFCEVNNPQSIAEKVKLLVEDSELKNKVIQNGYQMVIENYSWESVVKKMNEIFNKL